MLNDVLMWMMCKSSREEHDLTTSRSRIRAGLSRALISVEAKSDKINRLHNYFIRHK